MDFERQYLVTSIDYGHQEWLTLKDIYRPLIKYIDMPGECFEFRFKSKSDLPLKGTYLQKARSQLYNKLSKLSISAVRVDAEDMVIVGDLMEKSMNQWYTQILQSINSFQCDYLPDEEQSECPFRPFRLPSEFEKQGFNAYITWEKIESRLIWIQLKECIETGVDEEAANYLKEFKQMTDLLSKQLESKGMRPMAIEQIAENMPCSSVYELDGMLYRGVMNDVDYIDQKVSLKYIDYGNVEKVNFNNLFELDTNYLKLPIQSVMCKLGKVYINKDHPHYRDYTTQLNINDMSIKALYNIILDETDSESMFAKFRWHDAANDEMRTASIDSYQFEVDVYLCSDHIENGIIDIEKIDEENIYTLWP